MAKAEKSPLGERLKIALKAAGVKAKDVAAKIGVPERAFYNWTMGIREPKITVLEKIVREFNINPNYILLGEGPPVLEISSKEVFLPSTKNSAHWKPVDHVCRFCGSRIMVRHGRGLSVGDVYKCHTCGRSGWRVSDVCWCGQRFRGGGSDLAYRCLPTRVMDEYPEVRELLDQAFRACGVDPERVEVGVVLLRDFNLIMCEAEARRAVVEGGLKAVPRHEQAVRDVERAIEEERKYLGTPLAAGLHIEKVWRDYLARGESHLFVRALIWKLLEVLEKICD